MTCLEKLQQDHPDLVLLSKEIFGEDKPCFPCPHMFGYASRPALVRNVPGWCSISCEECWNREVENTEGNNENS